MTHQNDAVGDDHAVKSETDGEDIDIKQEDDESLHHTNGSGACSGGDGGTYYGLDKTQVTRLMMQTLQDMGYSSLADQLQADSGCMLEQSKVSSLRKEIMAARWGEAVEIMKQFDDSVIDTSLHDDMLFAITRQQFLELVEAQEHEAALKILRSRLAQLHPQKHNHEEQIEALSKAMLYTPKDLYTQLKWKGSTYASRLELMQQLQQYMSPALVLPPHRLATLLNEVKRHQVGHGYTIDQRQAEREFSLYQDYKAPRGLFPNITAQVLHGHDDEVWAIEFSHDGGKLASGGKDGAVKIWECTKEGLWREYWVFVGHSNGIAMISWSPDDRFVISGSHDKSAIIWSIEKLQQEEVVTAHDDVVSFCQWLPDGRFLTATPNKEMCLWSSTLKELARWDNQRVMNATVTADMSKVVALTYSKDIVVYDLSTAAVSKRIPVGRTLTSVTVSQDSRYALVSVKPGDMYIWDLETARVVRKFVGQTQHAFYIRSCFGGVDEQFVLSGSEDGCVYAWNRHTSELLEALPGHTAAVNTVRWSSVETDMFATASDDHTIRIWRPRHRVTDL